MSNDTSRGGRITIRIPCAVAVACLLISPLSQTQPLFYTYTGISGFYDYQTNYRTPQYIRACPGSQMIHAIMMIADDSLAPNTTRGTAYAFSSDGGTTWTTFNQLRVPARRSGFPSLDIGQGPIACAPIIANHSIVSGGPLQSTIFVDYPPGSGAFAEIPPPGTLGGDEPEFPEVAGPADGSVVLVASQFASGSIYYTRTPDFISWHPWSLLISEFFSDGYIAEANSTGRVGILVTSPSDRVLWFESTDNGVTFPSTPTQLLPAEIPAGSDTFVVIQGHDLAYPGTDTLVTFATTKLAGGNPASRYAGIGFWSETTGFVHAVPHNAIDGVVDTLRKRQVNQNPVGYPAIGLSGSTIVVAFQAFMPETSQIGFNYSDIFFTYSTNRGNTWSHPLNITHTTNLDERYPSISKWNPPGQAYIVYQEDPQPGSAVFGSDSSRQARVRQRFCRISGIPTEVAGEQQGVPLSFSLEQNYPNPFNPSTTIKYSLSSQERGGVRSQRVLLRVYDVLGREVTTLVDELKAPGHYQVTWDARSAASGVYLYRLQTGSFSQTRKLILMR